MQTSSADNLPSLSSTSPLSTSTSPFTSTQPPTTTWPPPTPRRARLLSTSEPTTLARRDAAARSAKSLIRDHVREDWTWPSPPTPSFPPPTTPDAPLQWRERDANSSSPSPEPESEAADPYRYDNPDSLATVVQTRKRKRRRRLLEEMRWNTGLQTYREAGCLDGGNNALFTPTTASTIDFDFDLPEPYPQRGRSFYPPFPLALILPHPFLPPRHPPTPTPTPRPPRTRPLAPSHPPREQPHPR